MQQQLESLLRVHLQFDIDIELPNTITNKILQNLNPINPFPISSIETKNETKNKVL